MYILGFRSSFTADAESVRMSRGVLHPEDDDSNTHRDFGTAST
jgi:hypothetical protein